MLFVPISFVVAAFLAMLLTKIMRDEATRTNRAAQALVAVLAALCVLIGLRWGYGIRSFLPAQAVLATLWPPLAWLNFHRLANSQGYAAIAALWPHGLPAMAVAFLLLVWPFAIDVLIVAVYLVYGLALLRLAVAGPDQLGQVRFADMTPARRALWATAAALIASAAIDLFIAVDIAMFEGRRAAWIISFAHIGALAVLGWAAAIAGRSTADHDNREDGPVAAEGATPDDVSTVARLDAMIASRRLFALPDLTLDRLARKTLIPARQISGAVNRARGQNVSQYINGFRVAEACRLLAASSESVTAIMLEAGFQTKSNFNREFRRVTGLSPVAWRASHSSAGAGNGPQHATPPISPKTP